ncbi:MAG: hypothetical protein WAV05_08605 [Anaerolineales bacterium]
MPAHRLGVATPRSGESLLISQVDRLGEAHAAVERPNSFSTLPNRPAKVRLGMGIWE